MRTMTAAEFKAKCLKIMDEVAETGEPVIVTKRGKPVARLVPDHGAARPRRPLRELFKGMIELADPDDDLSNALFTPEEFEAWIERRAAKHNDDLGR